MHRTLAVVAVAAVLLSGAPARAEIINGSLETPVVAVGGFTSFSAASPTPPSGWSIVGPGSVSLVSGELVQGAFSFPAQDGDQWMDLTGLSSNTASGIQQTVSTTPGATYDLSFWVGNVANFPFPTTSSTVNVFVNGIPTLAATNTSGGTTLTWQEFELSFVAAGPATTLTFLNGDSSVDNSNGLDNIVLTARDNGSPVPEPGTLGLLGIATVAAVVLRRVRKGLRESAPSVVRLRAQPIGSTSGKPRTIWPRRS